MSVNRLISEHWRGEEHSLPGISCIAYPDGTVTILNCYSAYNPNTKERKFFCSPLCDTTIESIEKYNAPCWTVVGDWVVIDYQDGKIHAGDGAMGNEGFIAHCDAVGNLRWGIFFENTNPIKSLKIKDRILIAINEHSELQLEINLDKITDIKMLSIANR